MDGERTEVVTAARAGDEAAFAELTGRYRGELQVHCYRLLGSVHDAEDLVQETFLRAWRRRETYRGTATFRAWLYKIATNACLDQLDRRVPVPLPAATAVPADPTAAPLPAVAVPWLRPCPDGLLLDEHVVARETVELAFLAAVQHLPARQRAVLVLRDVLGWPAAEVADLLDSTVASANSALQRARATMRTQLPARRLDWAARPSGAERAVVDRYMAALEQADDAALAGLLAEDVRCSQAPWAGGNMSDDPVWYSGRAVVLTGWQPVLHGPDRRAFRCVATRANGCPAIATYVGLPGARVHEPFGLSVLRVVDGMIAEITVYGADLYPLFGLPATR